jgi:hypothetical protein
MKNMKAFIKIQIVSALVLAIMFMFNACTDNFDKLNTPNDLVTEDIVNVDLMFTSVQVAAIHKGAPSGQSSGSGSLCGMTSRDDGGPFGTGDSPGEWNNYYMNYGRNLSDVIDICRKRNEANGNNDLDNKIAMARIMKVLVASKVTDFYGDVPYSEANLPIEQAILTPKYDTQKSIYEDFFSELEGAIAQLNPALSEGFGSADLMYGGKVEKWKKFAYSLWLRLALRVRYADQAMAKANIDKIMAANDLITSLDDDAYIMSANDILQNANFLYSDLLNRGEPHQSQHVGKTLVDILIGSGTNKNPADPRLALYADTAYARYMRQPGYTWQGEPLEPFYYRGKPLLGNVDTKYKNPYALQSTSMWSAFWYAPVIERPVLMSSEVHFALAEAALFGLIDGDANAHYQQGIDQAIAWAQRFYETSKPQISGDVLKTFYSKVYPDWSTDWEATYFADKEITQAEIDAYKAAPDYTLSGTTEEKFEMIMNQKMVALYPNESQGEFEWRRTGYPRVLYRDDNGNLNGKVPRREPWPQVEKSLNADSYQEALDRIGGVDDRLVRVWWDANPVAPHEHPGEVESGPSYIQ